MFGAHHGDSISEMCADAFGHTHVCDGSCILHLLLKRGQVLMTVLIIYLFNLSI